MNSWSACSQLCHWNTSAGLCARSLGDQRAIRYLRTMLDDPPVETPTSYDPGESMRAAQALCDIFDWPFEWHRDWVAKTCRRWERMQKANAAPP